MKGTSFILFELAICVTTAWCAPILADPACKNNAVFATDYQGKNCTIGSFQLKGFNLTSNDVNARDVVVSFRSDANMVSLTFSFNNMGLSVGQNQTKQAKFDYSVMAPPQVTFGGASIDFNASADHTGRADFTKSITSVAGNLNLDLFKTADRLGGNSGGRLNKSATINVSETVMTTGGIAKNGGADIISITDAFIRTADSPEPGALFMCGSGLMAFSFILRRNRRPF